MPTVDEPNETRKFWFKSDADKPLAERPFFICAAPSKRLMKQYWPLYAESFAKEDERLKLWKEDKYKESMALRVELLDMYTEMALMGVVGWKNFATDPFKPESLETFDENQLFELATGWTKAFDLTEEDRKKSLSPSPSGAENSAPIVTAENVQTNQA